MKVTFSGNALAKESNNADGQYEIFVISKT